MTEKTAEITTTTTTTKPQPAATPLHKLHVHNKSKTQRKEA
jgi:hypothetical protein